jgi:glycine/D-amino acid oxidase-like deaminating enzyme/nitrite reductase/ring-hydroxylating ferredoxin subunit
MERWGRHHSIWYHSTSLFDYAELREDLKVDTVIVGGGITGVTTALRLLEAGQKVALIAAGKVGEGATGQSTGHLTQVQDYKNSELVSHFGKETLKKITEGLGDAIASIEGWVKTHSIDCDFFRVPGYKFTETRDGLEILNAEFKMASDLGFDVTQLKSCRLPFPTLGALRFENQAMFNPWKFSSGLIHKLVKKYPSQFRVFEDSRVVEMEDDPSPRVHTRFGSISASQVVLATHTPIGVYLSLHTRVAPYFSYVMAAVVKEKIDAGLYWDTSDPYFYLRPFQPMTNLWIVGGRDHKTGQELSTLERYIEMENYLSQHFEIKEIKNHWGGEFYEPADDLPYVGKIPFTSHFYTATGFSGVGLTFGVFSSGVISDLLLGRKNPYSECVDPYRVKPVASASKLIRENMNVAKWLVGDRLAHHEIAEIKLIAPHEGRVVDFRGQKLAIYRTEKGSFHCLSPTCTHLKCTVHWNSAEKSWDCPCHGGRYTPTGEVLEGPPLKSLEEVPLFTELEVKRASFFTESEIGSPATS